MQNSDQFHTYSYMRAKQGMMVYEDLDLDSLQPMEVVKAAEDIIKGLKVNPTPGITELLKKFIRDVLKHHKEESRTSSSEVPSHENQRWIGEKLMILSNKHIGKGSDGTVVYEGFYERRPVAVKRLLLGHHELAEKEIKNLIVSDHHRNIVRYHGVEWGRDFVYLALERCHCNLDDLIQISSSSSQYEHVSNDFQCRTISVTLLKEDRLEPLRNALEDFKLYNEKNGRPLPLLRKLMMDIVAGLAHLHELRIVHRDLKPQNVLIIKETSTLCAKLSDMGISKSLPENKYSLGNHFTGCEATGWKAPEQLLQSGRQMREMDLFSLGCILFFCTTNGKHPFGEQDERDRNIKINNKQNRSPLQNFPEAFHLIPPLLEADPEKRPKAIEVLHHPLFWDAEKRLFFLHDTSDQVSQNYRRFKALESTAPIVLGTISKGKVVITWDNKIDENIVRHMYLKRAYDSSSVRDLLRLIRNMLNHYEQLPKDIQVLVGSLYEGFDDYFTSRFPMLIIEVYKVMQIMKEEGVLQEMFEREYLIYK